MRYYWNAPHKQSLISSYDPNSLSGFYVTGRLGAMIPSLPGDNTYISDSYTGKSATINMPTLTASQPNQSNATDATLAMGAGKIFANHVYLGIEGIIEWSKKDINSFLNHDFRPTSVSINGQIPDQINHNLTLNMRNFEPAIDAKVGMLMPYHFLPYIRAGVAYNKVDYEVSDQLTYFNRNNSRETISLNFKDDKGFKGNLRLGAGIEYQYSENNTFSLNYIYTYYGKFNISKTQTTVDSANNLVTLSDMSRLTLKSNMLSIGYTHYFGQQYT